MLDDFMRSSGTSAVSERVQQIIMMGVDFYKSRVVEGQFSIINSLKVWYFGEWKVWLMGTNVVSVDAPWGKLSMIERLLGAAG